jgi:hypothetical protein
MLRNFTRSASWFLIPFIAGMLLLASTAMADASGLSAGQIAALEERVRARWQTKIERDFGKTWEFSTPNFREVFPKALYVQKFSYMVEWELTSVEVVNYDADAAVASVAARVMTKPTKQTSTASRAIGAVPITIREQWILIDGEWWHSTND